MPQVGFELTIPVFALGKTVHALGRAATVFGSFLIHHSRIIHSTIHGSRSLKICLKKTKNQIILSAPSSVFLPLSF
jgi:hypothetical protein